MTRLQLSRLLSLGSIIVALSILFLTDFPASGDNETAANHDDVACNRCHTMVADLDGSVGLNRDLTSECLKCHHVKTIAYSGIELTFHEDLDKRCQSCHKFHQTNALAVSNRDFTVVANQQSNLRHCVACHQKGSSLNELSPGHREAVKIYHSDARFLGMLTPSEACMVCHSSQQHQFDGASEELNTPTFNRLASHPYSIAYRPRQNKTGNKDDREEQQPLLIDDRVECITCHSLNSVQKELPYSSEQDYQLCVQCHSDKI